MFVLYKSFCCTCHRVHYILIKSIQQWRVKFDTEAEPMTKYLPLEVSHISVSDEREVRKYKKTTCSTVDVIMTGIMKLNR